MPLQLPPLPSPQPLIEYPIQLDEGAEIKCQLKRPTFHDMLHLERIDDAAKYFLSRLQAIVVSWDVSDVDGNPLPLTVETLERLIDRFPQAYGRLRNMCADMFYRENDEGEEIEKNLPGRLPDGGTVAPITPSPNSMPPSESSANASEETPPAAPSAPTSPP